MKFHLLLAAFLMTGASTASLAQKKPQSALVVVDATAKTIGRYGGYSGEACGLCATGAHSIVYAPINGMLVSIKLTDFYNGTMTVNSTQFVWLHGVLYFASSDCSGDPMIPLQSAGGATVAEVYSAPDADQRLLYVAKGAATFRQVASVIVNGSCSTTTGTHFLFETQPPVNLSALFTEPFHVE